MRNTRQLLELLLKQIQQCPLVRFYGMCGEVDVMARILTEDEVVRGCFIFGFEHTKLLIYIMDNEPDNCEGFWWECGIKKPRIEWIKEHIKLN